MDQYVIAFRDLASSQYKMSIYVIWALKAIITFFVKASEYFNVTNKLFFLG
jgi:hypothetical protein